MRPSTALSRAAPHVRDLQATQAVADVLLGDASPSGRLPVSFPFNNYTEQSDFTSMSMRRWPGRTHRHLQVRARCLLEFGC